MKSIRLTSCFLAILTTNYSGTIDLSKATFIRTCGEGERGSQVTEIWLVRK